MLIACARCGESDEHRLMWRVGLVWYHAHCLPWHRRDPDIPPDARPGR